MSLELTIELTNFCEEECDYCSSSASKDGKAYIDYEKVLEFFHSVDTMNVDRINISGGEPLAHPDFYKIKRACDIFIGRKNVYVYTNLISKIVYNTDIIPEVEVHANVLIIPGRKPYVPKLAHVIHLLKLVIQGRAKKLDLPDPEYHVSGNFLYPCKGCNHKLLQADGKIVNAPCKKEYNESG